MNANFRMLQDDDDDDDDNNGVYISSSVCSCALFPHGFVRAMENQTNNDQGLPPIERLQTALGPVLFSVLLIFSQFVLVAFCVWFCCCLGVFECHSVWLFLPSCLLCFMVSVKLWTGFVFCVVCFAFLSCGLIAKFLVSSLTFCLKCFW